MNKYQLILHNIIKSYTICICLVRLEVCTRPESEGSPHLEVSLVKNSG